jgi:peptide/nickel transport system ATP-binding protein
MTAPVLSIENLSVVLPGGGDRKRAVNDVSLEVKPGEILCIVGESGSGKSVLLSAIMRALPHGLAETGGRICLGGEDISKLSERALREIRGSKVAMIFQEPMASLNPAMTIGKQIEEMLLIHAPDMKPADRQARVLHLLTEIRLPNPEAIAKRYPHQLSGGQCQRVVIAMALVMEPLLLLADEPTTALDVTTQAQILKMIRELCDVHRHGIIFVTHDFGVVADIADRVAVMKDGCLVEIGSAAEILNHPQHDYTKKLIAAVPHFRWGEDCRPIAEPIICINGLSRLYGPVAALDNVTINVTEGSTLAIVGESGSGKSTLAKVITRLIEPSLGGITIAGHDFATISGRALMRQRRLIQMIFQDPYGSLNPRRSVGDLLVRAGMLGGLDRRQAKVQSAELIERVGLKQAALKRKPREFSGGQRQRIGIARALAMRPKVLIADESVSALDVSVQKQILELLAEIKAKSRLTLLFITHDLRVAAQVADEVLVMRRGKVVEHGLVAQVLDAPNDPYTIDLIAATPGKAWEDSRRQADAVIS